MPRKSGSSPKSARPLPQESKLRVLIEADVAQGNLHTSRSGKINRKYYAKKIGCTPSNLTVYSPFFREYEIGLKVQTGPIQKLEQIRIWLEEKFTSGEVPIESGRIRRTYVFKHWGLSHMAYSRVPEIKHLIDGFDQRVIAEQYQSKSDRGEIERLTLALVKPPVAKNWLTVSLKELSRRTGIEVARLKTNRQFYALISEKETQIREYHLKSDIDPLVHGIVRAFSVLSNIWPIPFLSRIGCAVKDYSSGKRPSNFKTTYFNLVGFLRWIPTSRNEYTEVVLNEAATLNCIKNEDAWDELLANYRNHLLAKIATGESSRSGITGHLKGFSTVIKSLSNSGIWPESNIRNVKNGRRSTVPRSSLASDGDAANTQYGKADSQIEATLKRAALDRGIELDDNASSDVSDFLKFESKSAAQIQLGSPEEIRSLLDLRLRALSTAAWAIVEQAMATFNAGKEIAGFATIDVDVFLEEYLDTNIDRGAKRDDVRKYFPTNIDVDSECRRIFIANLLKIIVAKFGGALPVSTGVLSPLEGFVFRRVRELGSIDEVLPYLSPKPDAVAAALTLYLIESGSNVEVGMTSKVGCLVASDLDGYVKISSDKMRPTGKPIFADLPLVSDAVKSLQWIESSSLMLRERSVDSNSLLFVARFGGRTQRLHSEWYRVWFKAFASNVLGISEVKFVPSMLRPSVLLRASLSNDGNVAVGMAIGQHSSDVTQRYQQRWPVFEIYDRQMRGFHDRFETVFLATSRELATRLGVSQAELDRRLNALLPTGFGTFCARSLGRNSEEGHSCSTLACWGNCLHLIMLAEVGAIATLQIWQQSLREDEAEWWRDRPERWERVWLPFLCLIDVVEEKMSLPPLLKIWNAASALAAASRSRPSFAPPHAW